MVNQHLKLFFKSKPLLITTLVFFIASFSYIFYYLFMFDEVVNLVDTITLFLNLSFFSFLYFLFVSFDYMYKLKRNNFFEALAATKNGVGKYYLSSILNCTLISLIYCVVIFIFYIINCFIVHMVDKDFIIHITLNIFLNIFIVSFIAILLAAAISFISKKLRAYLVITLTALVFSPVFTTIIAILDDITGVYLFPVSYTFDIFPPAINWAPISSFGYSLLSYRFQIALFWILIITALLVYKICTKKTVYKIISVVLLAGSLVSYVFFSLPTSKVLMNEDKAKGAVADSFYYENINQQETETSFNVTQYDIDFKIDRILNAQVTVSVDKNNLDEYQFTLYHGYVVTEVLDNNNNPLNFTHEEDFLSIKNNADKNIESVKIIYNGYAPKFFSNSQAVDLPGFFAYYPRSGYHSLFNNSSQGFNRIIDEKPVQFNVKVDSKKQIYCNLDETGNNTFSGKSSALTIMSGFLKSITVEGIKVVYPYLDINQFTEEQITLSVVKYINEGIFNENIKTIFVLPNTNMASYHEKYAQYSDHVTLTQFANLEFVYEVQAIDPNKSGLYIYVNQYESSPERFLQMGEQIKLEEGHERSVIGMRHIHMCDLIKEYGGEYFVEKCNEYMKDDNDTRSIDTFLAEFKK